MALAVADYKDGFTFTGLTSGSAGPFRLSGGAYHLVAADAGLINATLEVLGPDGSTYIAINTAGTAVGSYDLPAGQYKVALGTGTSLSAALIRTPYHGE